MRFLRSCVLAAIWLASANAAPRVEKVEPPNWWVPHTYNPVQLLLTGSELKGAAVTTASKGFRIDVRSASENGRYLFVYLTIGKEVKPGAYRFQVKSASGTGEFTFPLDRPLETRGRFQGFSPDDVIYLLMPDRFANGDPSNDSPPEFEFPADRTKPGANHGGDIRGIRDHLGYLKDLGVTGVWFNPIAQNSYRGGSAYHGYAAVDFYKVDPRFGTIKDFRDLVDAAHQMGIKVIQDQVENHAGLHHPWAADQPTPTWFNVILPKLVDSSGVHGMAAVCDPYARPKRRDDLTLRTYFERDFDQRDPLVTDYLIQNTLWWIGTSGLDGIRQDTYPYVDRTFWEKWQTAIDRQYPSFVVVGEAWDSKPAVVSFFQGGVRRFGVDTKLKSLMDFPLQAVTRSVFAQGQPMTQLTDMLAQDFLYLRPELLVAFVGNHDQPRFLTDAGGDISKLLMAQAFVLTTRRVPHLYYGDEVAMGKGASDKAKSATRADFPGGFPGDPVNAFTPEGRTGDAALIFNWMRDLLHFRQAHPSLRRGGLVQLLVNQDQYAYLRSSPEEHVLVVLNRAGNAKPIEIEVDDLRLPEGLRFKSFPAGSPDVTVSAGKLVVNQPKEIQIYWAAIRP